MGPLLALEKMEDLDTEIVPTTLREDYQEYVWCNHRLREVLQIKSHAFHDENDTIEAVLRTLILHGLLDEGQYLGLWEALKNNES